MQHELVVSEVGLLRLVWEQAVMQRVRPQSIRRYQEPGASLRPSDRPDEWNSDVSLESVAVVPRSSAQRIAHNESAELIHDIVARTESLKDRHACHVAYGAPCFVPPTLVNSLHDR